LKGEPELEVDFMNAGARVVSDFANLLPTNQLRKLRNFLYADNSIVHAHLPRSELIARFAIWNQAFFITRHNTETFFGGLPRLVSKALSRLVTSRAEKVIAISKAVKIFLLEEGEVKNSNKIEIVHYGFERKLDGTSQKIQLDKLRPRIGTIARLTKQKDLVTLILAFKIVVKKFPSATLEIVGDGPQFHDLLNLVRQIGIQNHVEFKGRLMDVYPFLEKLDTFVLTSKYEGFGMVLLEAIDAGVPIIASNSASIPEVLGESYPGLCRVGDARDFATKITKSFEIPFRKSLISMQTSRCRQFETVSMAKRIQSIYVSVFEPMSNIATGEKQP